MGIITEEIRTKGHLAQRKQALENYYKEPRYCKQCGVIILVKMTEKPSETNKKRFCSKSCAAIYNNKKFPKKIAKIWYCEVCREETTANRKYCDGCLQIINSLKGKKVANYQIQTNKYNDWSNINQMTKQEVLEKSGNSWTMKCTITRCARRSYRKTSRQQSCQICGYDKHINICHIKDIKDFPANSLIGEINDLNNLIALCPNHHWEFDHNRLDCKEIKCQ